VNPGENSPDARLQASLKDARAGRVTRHDSVELLMQWLDAWPIVLLGEACKTTSGGTPSRKNPDFFDGSIPWVKSGELPDGPVFDVEESISEEALRQSSAKLFPAGTLLIALYGATVGKLGILTKPAATNQAVCAIFPSDEIDTKFLFWFLRFKRSDLVAQAVGGAQPNISQGIIRSIEIPIPHLDQQKHIVAEIEKQFSRLDEAVANLKRVKANLKRYKAAVLKAAVEGRLVETEAERAPREGRSYETGAQLLQRILETRRSQWQGKGKYKEPAAPDTTDLPELPEGWVWASFDQVTERVTKGSSPNWQGFEYCDKGIPFVRSQNVGWGMTDLSDIAFLPPEFNEVEKKSVLREGDVLLNIVGASIGRAAIAPSNVQGGNVNQAVAVIRLLETGASKQFALLYLLSAETQRRIHAEKVDVARANFSLEDIRNMPLALPPFAEQQRLVAEVDLRLSLARKIEVQVSSNAMRADLLRKTLLAKAFRSDQKEFNL
jgi:type I restriction enzyme, S subunit